jgi:hypothetical protein
MANLRIHLENAGIAFTNLDLELLKREATAPFIPHFVENYLTRMEKALAIRRRWLNEEGMRARAERNEEGMRARAERQAEDRLIPERPPGPINIIPILPDVIVPAPRRPGPFTPPTRPYGDGWEGETVRHSRGSNSSRYKVTRWGRYLVRAWMGVRGGTISPPDTLTPVLTWNDGNHVGRVPSYTFETLSKIGANDPDEVKIYCKKNTGIMIEFLWNTTKGSTVDFDFWTTIKYLGEGD